MQKKVDAGRYAGAGKHRPVNDKHPIADDIAPRLDSLKFIQMVVVRGGAPPGEQASMSRKHRAGADRNQLAGC